MDADTIRKEDKIHIFLAAILVACLVLSFWPILQKLLKVWNNDDNSYCFLVVPLFLYLCWEKRRTFDFTRFSWNAWGVVAVAGAVFIIIIGQLGSVITLYFIGIWASIVSLAYLVYGKRVKQMVFPFIILLFIVPFPPYINNVLTFQLKLAASALATLMLRLSGISVFLDGNIIDLGITQLQVVEACSGLRYLMPLFLLALLIGYFFTKGWWRRGVLVLLVVPLSVFFNASRIWLSGILTVKGHPELVENFFHDFSGWVIFMIAGAVLFGVTRLLNRVGGKEKVQSELKFEVPKVESENMLNAENSKLKVVQKQNDFYTNDVPNDLNDQNVPNELTSQTQNTKNQTPSFGLAKPVTITVITCLLFVTSGWALKQIPSATNLPARQSFQSFPTHIGQWEGRHSIIPQKILDQLWSDDYVEASFTNSHTRNTIHLLIPFYEWQGTRHTSHAPQACLLGGGWALTGSQEKRVAVEDGREIPVMTLMLEKGSAKILGSYFFFQRGRVLISPWMNKAFLMWDAFTKRRTDGALVRAELVMAPGQSVEDAWEKLEGFIADLWPILPKYVPL